MMPGPRAARKAVTGSGRKTATERPENSNRRSSLASVDVDGFSQTLGAARWNRNRELYVGGLTEIVNPDTSESIWQADPRSSGHELNTLTINGAATSVGHDLNGNVTSAFNQTFEYDAAGRMSVARVGSSLEEAYFYVAAGKQ